MGSESKDEFEEKPSDEKHELFDSRMSSSTSWRSWKFNDFRWGLCEYVIVHTILGGTPVILWISLGGKPKWLPLKFGYHDVMPTSPIDRSVVRTLPRLKCFSVLIFFHSLSYVCVESYFYTDHIPAGKSQEQLSIDRFLSNKVYDDGSDLGKEFQ